MCVGVHLREPSGRGEAERAGVATKSFLADGPGPCGELAAVSGDKRGQSLLGFNSRGSSMDEPGP